MIAIIGAGLMGKGLARLFISAGHDVRVHDTHARARAELAAEVAGVEVAESLEQVAIGADFVIEAASERLDVKQAIFADLVALAPAHAILATNSSVIPVGSITALLEDRAAARCVGTHFWNPPELIPLVEVIEGPRTSAETVSAAMSMLVGAGKEPVHVRKDVVPGNRLQHALWREAMALVEEGVCTPADVDHVVKRSFGLRLPVLGPLENADLVGLELTRQIHDVVLPTLSRATSPSPVLLERLASGMLGAATGEGFYKGWTAEKVAAVKAVLAAHLDQMLEPVTPLRGA